MESQGRILDFSGQQIFVGIDVHRKSWRVSVIVGDMHQKTIHLSPPDPQALISFLHRFFPGGTYMCAYEAGFCGFWAQRELTQAGIKTIVAHAADIPTTDKERQQKNDVRDSRKIARSLSSGQLEAIYVPNDKQQRDRALVRRRWSISTNRRRAMNRIKMHMHFFKIYPPGGVLVEWTWTKEFIKWLNEQGKTDDVLNSLLQEYEAAREMERKIMRQIRQLFKTEPYNPIMELLTSVPGVGLLSAVLFLSEIIDINRFKSLDELCFYVGLVPKTDSSGDQDRVGHRTSRGNKKLRTALIECAWRSLQQDTEMMMHYLNYKKRMDAQHAIIKIARKLLSRIRYVWRNGKPYVHLDSITSQTG
jgi:transposase